MNSEVYRDTLSAQIQSNAVQSDLTVLHSTNGQWTKTQQNNPGVSEGKKGGFFIYIVNGKLYFFRA